jgi:two-component system, chemotaxis family, chemotaxis protein CheY
MVKKILLIDDSAIIHQMYRMTLSRYKCQLVAANNGKDGLEKLSRNSDVNLILVDINMPIMNGLEFITKVNEVGSYGHIPIVIVSTEGREEDTQRGLALGAKAYLKKPFQPSDLHAVVEKLCSAS